ncbi:zinc finger CCCH domain-containing protein 7B-like isoform X1 [Coregonus clupeaformis]|uniref:zinc finger CCCH domain-containing protein 7B-like isoform X1 n=2 Tax=Coregonus clupeaformis TaxID=59861 RepID=UPI001BDFC924|nr:zinc finger CCCH domain-containing protein 7B-like isoform X1 [Coregonus clupeaformis]
MDLDRQKCREGIQNALGFIRSSLPYPEPEGYKVFLTQLVCNLLDEGNAMFREGEWQQAIKDFSEGVNVAHYAQAESLEIPSALMESLYVNRAAAYHSMGQYEQGVQDCDSALALCKDSCRALYRKALCLKELGRFREAYNCSTGCLLTTPNDKHVYELAQELANKLGLKIRKAYISTQKESATSEQSNGNTVPFAGEMYGSGLDSLSDISSVGFSYKPVSAAIPVSDESSPPPSGPLVYSKLLGRSVQGPRGLPFSVPESEHLGDSELMGDDLDSLLDCLHDEPEIPPQRDFPTFLPSSGCVPIQLPFPSGLPAPSPRLPPAFFNSAISQLNSLDTFPGIGGRDALGALDSLDGLDALDSLDALNNLDNLSGLGGGDAPAPTTALDSLDALDSFSPLGGAIAAKPVVVGGGGLDSLSEFNQPGARISHNILSATRSPKKSNHTVVKNGQVSSKLSLLTKNTVAATHDFKQACATCYSWIGPGVLDYLHQAELAHRCKRDICLCRIRASGHPVWNRVRPRPTNNFTGPFMLCKEVLETQKCKYREGCTFAYCQEEVDVWTLERKGALNRELLFDPQSPNNDRPTLGITCLLQLHNGMFMYLCEECYDSKPRIISKRSKEVPSICSNLSARHPFDKKKCLVHAVRSSNVHYTKIRPLYTQCQLDVCRHARRYGCQREDSCSFAHSVIELKCWMLQQDSGITHEEIVQESKRHWHKQEQNTHKPKPVYMPPPSSSPSGGGDTCRGGGGGYSLNLKRKFVCGQCWRDGLVSEPDKALKYCTAKARHSWTKERRVLLVKSFEGKKWVMVRTLPFAKTYPQQYDICAHVVKQKKCHYIGNCAFAHSEEEKQVWTYMKNNGLKDMQQLYDMWLTMTNQNRQPDDPLTTQPMEEKQIAMPTDYAEPMSGFHCRLCGKHSNSERQWQQHISSEKHKDRVFSCEGEDESLTWTYRFPGLRLALCPRLESGCPEGVSCDYAHSDEELVEWQERREFLRQKLAKAREDMLIMPDEFDFGKYNFLLQD